MNDLTNYIEIALDALQYQTTFLKLKMFPITP